MEALLRKRWRHSKRTCFQLNGALGCRWGHCIIFRFFQKKVLVKTSLRLISRYSINHPLKNPSLYVKLFEYFVENCWIGPITRQGFICITTLLTLRLIILHVSALIFLLEVAWTSACFHGRSLRFWRCTLGKKAWTSEGGMLLQNVFFFYLGAQKYHFLQFPQEFFH